MQLGDRGGGVGRILKRQRARERSAAKRRARRQIVEQCLRSDIHMFAEVGLHLENRITVCPTVPGPSTGRETARQEESKGRKGSKTMKLRCTPRAQVAFQVRLLSGWSRRVVTMRRRDCKIDGMPNPFSHYAAPFYSCSPVERFRNTASIDALAITLPIALFKKGNSRWDGAQENICQININSQVPKYNFAVAIRCHALLYLDM